jgi:hypothetical protein
VAIALLFLAAGQLSSAISPLLLVRVEGIALGDYHGAAIHLAPLSNQVVDDANRDALTSPTPTGGPSAPAAGPGPLATATPPPPAGPPPATGSITGTVQDSQTAIGIANALVSLSPGGLSTLTSSNGAFGFPTLAAGSYAISAGAPGYQSAGATVTVTAGHNANINLHLVSTAGGGSVQGVVKSGATGKAIVGAIVTLTPGSMAMVTDATGYYGFPSVTAGTYTLTVTAAGYQPSSQTISVRSGHTNQVNVSLTPI